MEDRHESIDIPIAHSRSPTRAGRRARHYAEIRERLLCAGLDLLRTQGFRATTVRQITERADLGYGTFYNYFPTIEHMLLAIAEWPDDQFLAGVDTIREGQKTVQEVMEERGKHGWRWTPTLFLSCISTMMTSQAVRPAFLEVLKSNRKKTEVLLRLGQERGEIRSDLSATELARILQYTSYGALFVESFESTGSPDSWLDNDNFSHTYWGAFWNSFCAATPRAKIAAVNVSRTRKRLAR